ncbi:MAG: glycoside hydrolase family 2 protein [Firmicutes bacterium]|nr:glycoside hydrolase family 2 protein [Bacillota bacterium]
MRNYVDLCSQWRFIKTASSAIKAAEIVNHTEANQGGKTNQGGEAELLPQISAEPISVPHTWNAIDGQDGGNDYYRGTCWYVRTLTKEELEPSEAGGRIYLEFEGVAMSCDVYLDGEKLYHHDGGYSLFRVDLSAFAGADHTLALSVSNEDNDRVYPQKADFTFYGGIYRKVRLVKVPSVHFALGYMGTSGFRVTPQVDLENQCAQVLVTAYVENAGGSDAAVTFETDGQVKTAPVVNGSATVSFLLSPVHLWDGVHDPYLYEMKASLSSGDQIRCSYGCRKMDITGEGFFLNGRHYPLRGVSRHQDRKGLGNALTLKEHEEDMAFIREIGANTVRLAHYQHAQEFYDLCDRYGIVAWAEIPYITQHMSGGLENTLSQMEELIVQNYNHPCIAVWGLSNEITAASQVNEELLNNHRLLNELCHRLDPTRKTTMADVFMLEIDSPILEIPDVNSYNLYFGWYLGELEQNDEFFDEYHAKYPERAIGFSEYGADANPAYHSSHPERSDYTEDYQAVYHEHILKMIEERPYLWATHVWNLFDFAADGRDEGGKHGENQKGLVTFDRKYRKDAFYLYKAAWNKEEAFVHLCGKGYVNRAEEKTLVKVYSNLSKVTLFVDGKEFAAQEGKRVFTFEVPISGEHAIEAKAEAADGTLMADSMKIVHVDQPDESYIYNHKAAQVINWFDAGELDPAAFSVQDTLGELRANPQAGAVVNAMMEKASAARGDVANAVKDNPALQRMMGRMTLISLLKQGGADEESIKSLNRILQGIKK